MNDLKNNTPQTDNGWFHINNVKPKGNEEVVVILERESSAGCGYAFCIRESVYRSGYPNGHFLAESGAWKVRFWRRKEIYPYPNAVVQREMEDCKKHNVSYQKIIEHQRACGIEMEIS